MRSAQSVQTVLDSRMAWYFNRTGRETPQSPLYMPFDDAGFLWKDGHKTFAYDGENLSTARQKEKALIRAQEIAHELYTAHANVVYVIGVISSGIRGYSFAHKNRKKIEKLRDDGRISTKNLAKNLGGDAFMAEVLYPSLVQNIVRSRMMEQNPNHRDMAIYSPSIGEKTTFTDNGHLGLLPDEVTYMTKHYPEIDCAKAIAHPGDWFSSRNGALETWRGTAIQMGWHPMRPQANIAMVDQYYNPMALFDRTKPILDILKMIVPQGFVADTHATVLLRSLFVDDVLKGVIENPYPSPNLHADLKFRNPDEEKQFDDLKKEAALFLYNHCRDFIDYSDFPPGYLEMLVARMHSPDLLGKKQPMPEPTILRTEDFDISPEITRRFLDNDFEIEKYVPDVGLLDNNRTYAVDKEHRRCYANPVYNELGNNTVRRTVIRLVLNSMATTLTSNDEPRATFILEDPKINQWTIDWCDKNGVTDYMKILEATAAAENNPTLKTAIRTALDHTLAIKDKLIEQSPSRFVLSQNDINTIENALKQTPYVFSDTQPIAFDSAGRQVMRDEIMMAFADEVLFGEKWYESPDHVYHMGRAFLLQNGLIQRPKELNKYRLKIKTVDTRFNTKSITIEDAIENIGAVILRHHKQGIKPSPYHGMVWLQLNDIQNYNSDFYMNRMENDIPRKFAAMTATITQKEEGEAARRKAILGILTKQAVNIFPDISWLDGLPEHTRRIYFDSQGKQLIERQPNYPDGVQGYIPRI